MGVTTITQDVNDFLRSPYGQAIVTNSALQLLMKQAPSAAEVVQKTFNLTDGEKYLLIESGIGEGIFFAGQKHAAIRVVASYTEDQIVTTNPQQLLDIERAKKEFEEQMEAQDVEERGEPLVETKEGASETQTQAYQQKAQEAASALLSSEENAKQEADRIRQSLSN